MNTIERLEEVLDQKDTRIEELEKQIEDLEQDLRNVRSGWTAHRKLPQEQKLPVPRLELTWTETDEGEEAIYCLVYRHLLGHCVAVPLGQTIRRGGSQDSLVRGGQIILPFRDGVHIRTEARTLNLPAFITFQDLTQPLDVEQEP